MFIRNLTKRTFAALFALYMFVSPALPLATVYAQESNDTTVQEEILPTANTVEVVETTPTPTETSTPVPTATPEVTVEPVVTTPEVTIETSKEPEVTVTEAPTTSESIVKEEVTLPVKETQTTEATPSPVWIKNSDGSYKTFVAVNTYMTYTIDEYSGFSISFSKLPLVSKPVTVKKVAVPNVINNQLTAGFGYEITSEMENGTFEYTINLPKVNDKEAEVLYSEDGKKFDKINNEKNNEDSITFKADHFTVFVVANPNPAGNGNLSNDLCVTSAIGGAVKCYSTLAAAIAASANGDTVNILSGESFTAANSSFTSSPLYIRENNLSDWAAYVKVPNFAQNVRFTITGNDVVFSRVVNDADTTNNVYDNDVFNAAAQGAGYRQWRLNVGLLEGEYTVTAEFYANSTWYPVTGSALIRSLATPWYSYVIPATTGLYFRPTDRFARIRIDDQYNQTNDVTFQIYNATTNLQVGGNYTIPRANCDLRSAGTFIDCDLMRDYPGVKPTLAEGTYYVKTQSNGFSGSGIRYTNTRSNDFVIDATKPTITSFVIDSVQPIYTNSITVSATATDNNIVSNVEFFLTAPRLSDGLCDGTGTRLASAIVTAPDLDGRYRFTADSSLLNGPFCLNAMAEDASNSHSAISKISATFDNTPPVVTVPANFTLEATDPSGATATYTSTANDNIDGALSASCLPVSGSTFSMGTTTVTCSATDSAGNTGTNSFAITVQDTNAPNVTVPANISVEATKPAGADVTFVATASDTVDTDVTPVTCTPASSSTFGITTTLVSCSATDDSGNTGTSTFNVTVTDLTPPTVTVPSNVTIEATNPSGEIVTYSPTPSATDLVDGTVATSCSPVSGSTFTLGTSTVTCSATDSRGNTGTNSFTVTIADTTAPTVTVPTDITAEATSSTGTNVSFTATATDLFDTAVSASCTPASGTFFNLDATTPVTCSSTDVNGNTGSATFNVSVVDTTKPTIDSASDITGVEATSAAGAIVTITPPTSHDIVDGDLPSVCDFSTGTFPMGTTVVTCSKTDAHSNVATPISFSVTVVDTTAPTSTLSMVTGTPYSYTPEFTQVKRPVFGGIATDIASNISGVACYYSVDSGATWMFAANATADDGAFDSQSEAFKCKLPVIADLILEDSYLIEARATDTASPSNTDLTPSNDFGFVIDRTDPIVEFTSTTPAADSYVKAPFTIEGNFDGTHTDDSRLHRVRIGITQVSTGITKWCLTNTTDVAAGVYNCYIDPATTKFGGVFMTDGEYTLIIRGNDKANNALELNRTIYLDRVAPVMNGDIAVSDLSLNEGDIIPTVTVTTTDNIALQKTCLYFELITPKTGSYGSIGGCEYFDPNTTTYTWNFNEYYGLPEVADTSILPEGEYKFTYWSVDNSDLESPHLTTTYTINNVAPYNNNDGPYATVNLNEGEVLGINPTGLDYNPMNSTTLVANQTQNVTFADPSTIQDLLDLDLGVDDSKWTVEVDYGTGEGFVQDPAFKYINEGTYTVKVKVTENYDASIFGGEGESSSSYCEATLTSYIPAVSLPTVCEKGYATFDVVVANVVPSVSTSSATNGNRSVTITANGIGGNAPLTYAWGSGNFANCTGTGLTVTTPTTAGTYNCTVTVTDFDGDTATATANVTVNAAPIVLAQQGEVLGENTEETPEVTPTPTPEVLGERTCTEKKTLKGTIYIDENDNNEMDSNEKKASGVKLVLSYVIDGKEVTVTELTTNENGEWSYETCSGDYKITIKSDSLPTGTTIKENSFNVNLDPNKNETNIPIVLKTLETKKSLIWLFILILLVLTSAVGYYLYRGNKLGK